MHPWLCLDIYLKRFNMVCFILFCLENGDEERYLTFGLFVTLFISSVHIAMQVLFATVIALLSNCINALAEMLTLIIISVLKHFDKSRGNKHIWDLSKNFTAKKKNANKH